MTQETRGSLRISGAGSASGGVFDEVRISGAGKVSGNIECNIFKSSGASTIDGDVKAATFGASGASEVKGSITANEITVSGSAKVDGDVNVKKIRVSGSTDIRGALHAENVEISGAVKIGGDCEAETFKARGGFDIGGLLNADDIQIGVYGRCRVREIGGEKIEIAQGKGASFDIVKAIKSIFTNMPEYLTADLIEGDNVTLDVTKAKVVRGKKVIINKDCEIDLVEYRDEIKISEGAKIKEQRKI